MLVRGLCLSEGGLRVGSCLITSEKDVSHYFREGAVIVVRVFRRVAVGVASHESWLVVGVGAVRGPLVGAEAVFGFGSSGVKGGPGH